MKAFQFLRVVIILGVLLLSACAGAPSNQTGSTTSNVGADKPLSEVVFTGSIEGMNGDQWVINGQTIQVDTSALRDGSFKVGDSVKVEARVADDGSVTAQRVESPSSAKATEAISTQAPQTLHQSETEIAGTVDSITDISVTLGGKTYTFAPGAEIKGTITVGSIVKVHLISNANGTLSVREITTSDPAQITDNSNNNSSSGTGITDDHSQDNKNDNNSNVSQGSDDGPGHDSGDDHGGNSSDDHSNDGSNHG